jgi:hypothetical protein
MDLESAFGLMPFSRREAMDRGITKKQWETLTKDKVLMRVRRDVYVVRWSADDRIQHCQKVAAALKGRSKYMACSGSALAILDLPNPYMTSWSNVPVTIAGPKSNITAGVRRNPGWVAIDSDWGPCTDAIDTAATIASELELPQALMVTDALARLMAGITPGEWPTNAKRIEVAAETCRVEVRRRLTRHCDLPALALANPAAEAPSESFYRGHMILRGFDDPRCGVPVRGASGELYFVDLWLPGLAIEVDGEAKIKNRQDVLDEKHREDDLRATGLHVLRSWVKDLYDNPEREMVGLDQKQNLLRVIHRLIPTLG